MFYCWNSHLENGSSSEINLLEMFLPINSAWQKCALTGILNWKCVFPGVLGWKSFLQ